MRPSLPDRMRVVEISRPGGPEVLKVATRPLPRLRSGEVLIHVSAAGVNRPDCFQRAGVYPPPPGASDLPGLEVAGTVVECAEKARQWPSHPEAATRSTAQHLPVTVCRFPGV
jgi:NADPH2:quinone reductase